MYFTKSTTKAIRKWLKDNGFNVSCRLGNEMVFDPNIDSIIVSKEYDTSADGYFMEFLREYGLTNDFDAITLSILHELGHAETEHLFSEEEWNNDMVIKAEFANQEVIDEREYNYKYWKTNVEFSANLWVIMYVKAFPEKVNQLEDIIEEFYNNN